MRGDRVNRQSRLNSGLLRWVALLLVALLGVAAVQRFWITPDDAAIAQTRPYLGPQTYAEEIEALDLQVTLSEGRVAASPDSWLAHEGLAIALHLRGQLSGSHEDLAAALAVADKARSLAPARGGPVLSRATIAMSLHRGDIAAREAPLVRGYAIPATASELSEAEAILGDVALYSGDYGEALSRYEASQGLEPNIGTTVRLADWHRHQGDFAAARQLLDEAIARGGTSPWVQASLQLQRGAIDLQTGDWKAAEAHFTKADAVFPGWWLARAHLGQMAATRGDFAAAEALYRQAMAGAERPSVMDALAAVLEQQGRAKEAAAIQAAAGALWKARVASHPAAYADHAFDAVLAEGDTARAWQLARLNYVTRPYGDGRIGLARAAAARGRHASARAIIEELERTGWRSTEQYRVLVDACERLGDEDCAQEARKKALAVSPLAFDERNDLHFFSNH